MTEASEETLNARLSALETAPEDARASQLAALGEGDQTLLLALAQRASDELLAGTAIARLCVLAAPAALEPLCDLFVSPSLTPVRRAALLESLGLYGPALYEPLMSRRERVADRDRRHDMLLALLRHGGAMPRDERLFLALCEYLESDPTFGAQLLASYGDPRALPLLEVQIFRHVPDFTSADQARELSSLLYHYRQLGGQLPAEIARQVEHCLACYQEALSQAQLPIGRNDPCACGSGKKYKKCCLVTAPPL